MKQTILHIGLEKTGTTSLQYLFRQNRSNLLRSKFLVSEAAPSGNNFHLAVASYSKFRPDGLTRQLGIFDQQSLNTFRDKVFAQLANELALNQPEVLLLSSEHFQSRLTSVEDIALLRHSLEQAGCRNFKVIVYLRDPLKIVMSHHGMAIKKGIHVTPEFYQPTHPRVSHIVDSRKTLENWSEVFGRAAIEPRLYPEGQPSQALIEDFLQACALTQEQLDLSLQEVRNVNLSAEALTALNNLNAKSKRVAKLAEDRWLFHQLEKTHAGRGLTPSPETIALFQRHFEQAHQAIARDWFSGQKPLFATQWRSEERPLVSEATERSIARLIGLAERRQRLTKPWRKAKGLIRKLAGG